ncbi:MAG: tyrosine-type recombinase/integrase [Candidatus Nitrosocaldus sp.]
MGAYNTHAGENYRKGRGDNVRSRRNDNSNSGGSSISSIDSNITTTIARATKGTGEDIHGYHTRFLYHIRRIEEDKRIADRDKEVVKGFVNALLISGIKIGRVISYVQFSYEILKIMAELNVRLEDLTSREDIDRIAGVIVNGKGWGNTTIAIALRTLKRLVHYAKHKEIAEGEGNYCKEVAHIKPDRYNRRAMKEDKVRATDLLTREEFLKMVEAVPKVSRYPARDRALLYVMYEFAARPSELLNMKVGNLRFYEGYAEITTEGKTGVKTLTLVLSYNALREWYEQHPLKEDPNAYLWYSKQKNKKQGEYRVSYDRLRAFLKRLAEVAGIRKRVWLYLIRHTALTHVEKEYGSSITEMYGNWRKGSPIRNRYIHLANSDQREIVLKRYGLLKEGDNNSNSNSNSSIIEPRKCYRCNTLNEPNARICKHCGLIIDPRYAMQIHNEREGKIKELEERLARVTAVVEELLRRQERGDQH